MRHAAKLVGPGTSFQTARPAAAAVSPRIGVYTHHLSRDSRRSQTFDSAATANAPSDPNTMAEKTSGSSETEWYTRSVTATLCRSASVATAARTRPAQIGGRRYPWIERMLTVAADPTNKMHAQATVRRSSALPRRLTTRSSLAYPPKGV